MMEKSGRNFNNTKLIDSFDMTHQSGYMKDVSISKC